MATIIMTKFKLTLVFLLVATITFAQKSPRKQATGKIGEVAVTVDYGAPSVNERTIWGDLVPYNKVWRAGANENTTVSFSKDVTIRNASVPAGKYGLFIIPKEEGEWEVIFSKKNDAWGSKGYDEKNDLLRVKLRVNKVPNSTEQMTFTIDKDNGILFNWEKALLLIPVQ
jgi:hypothetical protein